MCHTHTHTHTTHTHTHTHTHTYTHRIVSMTVVLLLFPACGRIREPKVHVVVAGYEHMKFRNHFPYWTHRTSVATCNNDHVIIHSPHDLDAADELKKLSRDQYSLEELQKKPLPEGVDPKKLESYLSNEEFNVSGSGECVSIQ